MRSRLTSLGVSLALHAGLIGLAAGVVYSVAAPRAAIPVALLPGGGGGSGSAPVAAVEPASPQPPQVVAKQPPIRPRLLPRKRERRERSAPVVAALEKNVEAKPAASGGEGSGSGAGSGTGSGGGVGSGSGAGEGSGRASGRAVDLRLYCISCPEPPYPRLARVRGWQGATDVELLVLGDGRVEGATITRSSGFEVLDRAALDVARQSRFSPPPRDVAPPVRGRLAYRFELRGE